MRASKKPKTEVAKRLKGIGADPVAELVAVARDDETDPKILAVRCRAWIALLEYCQPKLRAIDLEVSGDKNKPVQLAFDWDALLRPSGPG